MAAVLDNEVVAKHAGGRPLKYPTVEVLANKIDDYFNSISYEELAINDIGEPILNKKGEQVVKTNYVSPPSILGLCLYLGISRDALGEYQIKSEFSDTIKEAKAKVEQYLADQLNRTTQVAGIIFNLKNNFGWKDIQTVENTGPNGGPILVGQINALSDDDLLKLEEIMSRSQIQGDIVDIEPVE